MTNWATVLMIVAFGVMADGETDLEKSDELRRYYRYI